MPTPGSLAYAVRQLQAGPGTGREHGRPCVVVYERPARLRALTDEIIPEDRELLDRLAQ